MCQGLKHGRYWGVFLYSDGYPLLGCKTREGESLCKMRVRIEIPSSVRSWPWLSHVCSLHVLINIFSGISVTVNCHSENPQVTTLNNVFRYAYVVYFKDMSKCILLIASWKNKFTLWFEGVRLGIILLLYLYNSDYSNGCDMLPSLKSYN